jgi:hypothetical protein
MLLAGVAAVAVAPLAAWATPAGLATSTVGEPCPRETVPAPAGLTARFFDGGDPSGLYQVGRAADGDEIEHLVLWKDGTAHDLGVPPLGVNAFAIDVNQQGEIIGNTFLDDEWRGWRSQGGKFTAVPLPPSAVSATAVAINSKGAVAGTTFHRAGLFDGQAAVWSADSLVRELTRPIGFNEARAADIDEDGTVIGTVELWDYEALALLDQRAVAWFPDGTWRFLAEIDSADHTEAGSIRNGLVVGTDGDGGVLAWNARSGGATELLPEGRPITVNSNKSVTTSNLELLLPSGVRRPLPIFDQIFGGVPVVLTDADVVYGYADFYDEDRQTSATALLRWNCGIHIS